MKRILKGINYLTIIVLLSLLFFSCNTDDGSKIEDHKHEYEFPSITVYPDDVIVDCSGFWYIYKLVNNSGGKITVVTHSEDFPASIVLQNGEEFEWARWWSIPMHSDEDEEKFTMLPFPERNTMKIYFNDKRFIVFKGEQTDDIADPRYIKNYQEYSCIFDGKNACVAGAREFIFTGDYFK